MCPFSSLPWLGAGHQAVASPLSNPHCPWPGFTLLVPHLCSSRPRRAGWGHRWAGKPFGQLAHPLQRAAVCSSHYSWPPQSYSPLVGPWLWPPSVSGVGTSLPWALVSRDLAPSCLGALAHWVFSFRGLCPATRKQRGMFWSCGLGPSSLWHSGDGTPSSCLEGALLPAGRTLKQG